MRIALAMLTRPALALAVVATASAVVVSQFAEPPTATRMPRAGGHVLISYPGIVPPLPGTLWLDKDTGRTTFLGPLAGEILQHASLSPWIDESGRAQLVGLLSASPGSDSFLGYTLARATFPEGRVIDRVAANVLPAGFPCWYPGTRARVLFAGSDEKLYQIAFEPPDGKGDGDGRWPELPRLIEWRCAPPDTKVRITDPCWPADDRFARVVLVGLGYPRAEPGLLRDSPSRIWWLRLNPEGDAIEEASPLLEPSDLPVAWDVRQPSVGRTPDGGLAVAYLTSAVGGPWDLRISPLDFDDSGRLRPVTALGAKLAGGCRSIIPPTFSSDGRWLYAMKSDETGRPTLLRLDLTALPTPIPAEPTPPDPVSLHGKWSPVVSAVQALFEEAQRYSPRGRTGEGS